MNDINLALFALIMVTTLLPAIVGSGLVFWIGYASSYWRVSRQSVENNPRAERREISRSAGDLGILATIFAAQLFGSGALLATYGGLAIDSPSMPLAVVIIVRLVEVGPLATIVIAIGGHILLRFFPAARRWGPGY